MATSPTITARKKVSVFLPGTERHANRKRYAALCDAGPTLWLARSSAELAGAQPGCWTFVAASQTTLYDVAMTHADRVFNLTDEVRLPRMSRPAFETTAETFAFCCVADAQYIPFFFALVGNLQNVHPGPLEIHLLAVDDEAERAARAQYPDSMLHLYRMSDVWTEGEWARVGARPIASQALTSKARIFLEARRRSSAEAVFLLDLDMYFFRSPARLIREFGEDHTMFFPQWSDRFTWARLHGIFNSGMMGARKGSEAFLSWWSRACWISCELDVASGRFGDQAYIDQAILFFDGIRIYREGDEDVAPWNLATLGAKWDGSALEVLGGKSVGSYHAAGPDALRIFEAKYQWDQLAAVFSVLSDPNESLALFRNTLEQQRLHWPELDRALRLRKLFEGRTFLPVAELTPEWVHRATSGLGARVLARIDDLHRAYAKWRGHALGFPVESENAFWIQLQKQVMTEQGL